MTISMGVGFGTGGFAVDDYIETRVFVTASKLDVGPFALQRIGVGTDGHLFGKV